MGGAAAVLVATVPASAFYSGSDPSTYYGPAVNAIEAHRGWQGVEGVAFEPVGAFVPRMPDDEFDDILLNLVNWYRGENGLEPYEQFEPLRVQSSIWSNKLADKGSDAGVDPWLAGDAVATCNPLEDIQTTSARSDGQPQDVWWLLLRNTAARNALLSPDAGVVGIATVSENNSTYTTMRIAHGSCPGRGLPYRVAPSGLPQPVLKARVEPSGSLAFSVQRRGDVQLQVQVQRAENGRWINWQEFFLQPGSRLTVQPPRGSYRVVVPAQSGYDTAMTELMIVPAPPPALP